VELIVVDHFVGDIAPRAKDLEPGKATASGPWKGYALFTHER
jgi:hypothetical protein